MSIVVLLAAFKYVLVEVGEQFVVAAYTLSIAGRAKTIRTTLIGLTVGLILFAVYLAIGPFVPARPLEVVLGIGLSAFAVMVLRRTRDMKAEDVALANYLNITLLEAVENSATLGALAMVDLTSTVFGAVLAIALLVPLILWFSLYNRLPMNILRPLSAALLLLLAMSLLVYGFELPHPGWLTYIVPPLK